MTPIRPDLLAVKLQAVRNGESEAAKFAAQLAAEPRLLETLWLIQDMSRRPGGGERFVKRLIEASPDRFQTKPMMQAGAPSKTGQWTFDQCLTAWQGQENSPEDLADMAFSYLGDDDRPKPPPADLDSLNFTDWLHWFIGPEVTAKNLRGPGRQADALRFGFDRFNFPFHKKRCLDAARHNLPRFLAHWCQEKSVACTGPWYCPDLLATLYDFMDRHATEAARELAETEVTKTVFRELEFARSQNVPVPIIGASRFGKTKAVSVWCEMRPGLARLVTVPDSNRERDFFAAHADAFGLQYNPSTSVSELKRQVEFVHRHSGLFLVYDEAHFLVPVSYHKATPPRRLNWLRCQVIDRDCGCAFFATPQSYRETLDAYVKKTGYCMEQWLGRLAPAVLLPESLEPADVMAVAKNHFPGVPEPFLKLVSARAMQSEGYLKNVEICVKRARFLAGERGHRAPTRPDIQDAIDYTMPAVESQAGVTAPRRRSPARVMQPLRSEPAAPLQAEPEAEFPRRESLTKVGQLEPALAG